MTSRTEASRVVLPPNPDPNSADAQLRVFQDAQAPKFSMVVFEDGEFSIKQFENMPDFLVALKKLLGADDSLDVFGVHGVGGILGALLTGVFAAPSLGGTGIYDYVANKVADNYDIMGQVIIQATGVGVTLVWSGTVAIICYKIVDIFVGLRVPEDEEREGLDITSHGESAYHG